MPGVVLCNVFFALSFAAGIPAGILQGMKEGKLREEVEDLEDGPVEIITKKIEEWRKKGGENG